MNKDKKTFDLGIVFEPDPSAWVPLVGPMSLHIRYLPPDERMDLAESCATKALKDGEVVKEYDDEAFKLKLCARAIIGWRGASMNGEPFPFTDENRDRLVSSKWDAVYNTVRSYARDLELIAMAREAEALKNSEPTSRPDSTTPA